jgi:hypothetical protein
MDEENPGVDPQDVLREIAAALPMEEPLPDAVPMEAAPPPPESAPAAAAPEPAPELASSPAPAEEGRPVPAPVGPPSRPSWWSAHRHELAGIVTATVSLVWISLGVASRTWGPCFLGVTFAVGAYLIGSRAVWPGD